MSHDSEEKSAALVTQEAERDEHMLSRFSSFYPLQDASPFCFKHILIFDVSPICFKHAKIFDEGN